MATTTNDGDATSAALAKLLPAENSAMPGAAAYERCCALWNGAISLRPAAVLHCTQTSDVQAGVRAAREVGVPISVRSGGHGWTGSALAEGGLTLDLSGMREVLVDPDAKLAHVGGGASSGNVAAAAHSHGLVAVTGTVGAVGMVGLSLGGGYGPLSGRFGLAVDNVVAVEIVTADGVARTVDAAQEPDLFWALRGGGGNFGVVTALRVALHSVPSIIGGMFMFAWDEAASVFDQLSGLVLDAPDELTVQCGIMMGPTGAPGVFVLPTWCGEQIAGEEALRRLSDLGSPLLAQFGPTALPDMLAQNSAMFPDGRHVEIRPRTLAQLTPGVREALLDGGATMTSPLSGISIHSLHGAATRVPAADTAFSPRAPHLLVENIAIWEFGDDAALHAGWVRDLSAALADYALQGGYPNLLAADEADQIAHAYDPNGQRLLAVKRAYDPDNVFAATPLPPAGTS